jgi:glutamate N-acetyltransferase/amino-acid N-acetyltransferase
MLKIIEGGVCAAEGFTAAGINCGIRAGKTKRDLSLIVSDTPASAAAVYTKNLVKGAPLAVTRRHRRIHGYTIRNKTFPCIASSLLA